MNLIQPSALWALGAIPLILLFYILRPRHRRLIVPSVRLWKQLPSDLEGRPRWRLPVTSLLLIAQVLIAAGMAGPPGPPRLAPVPPAQLLAVLERSPPRLASSSQP